MKDDTELISSKHSPNLTTWNFIMNINFTWHCRFQALEYRQAFKLVWYWVHS